MASDAGYLLDNRRAGARLDLLSSIFDPWTFRHLDDLGIAAGWRCWEVGAGGPSVARWLARRVGPTGSVVATDIDVSWLPSDSGIEVRRHDVGRDPAPGTGFDLAHARLVLVHVPPRDAALRSMVASLRPGGWLLVEDADPALQPLACPDEYGAEQRLANRLRSAFRALLEQRGAHLGYGRTLPRRLRALGLHDVSADAFFPLASPASAALEAVTVEQVREQLIASGLATHQEVDEHLANLGRLDLATSPLISAWGRARDC